MSDSSNTGTSSTGGPGPLESVDELLDALERVLDEVEVEFQAHRVDMNHYLRSSRRLLAVAQRFYDEYP